ncbi:MAG: enoyl-CoA hydratase/isomerase family protein [Acidobacteria bacterium]|nr:enoyl-CoA hydratase/isomerase family protein [Acidobacteriota bacterium]
MSQKIFYERQAGLGLIRMDDRKANAIQDEFIGQFQEALDRAEADRVRALVLTGREGMFSGGLDLKTLPALPGPDLKATLQAFSRLMQRVFIFPAPVVCAAGGHALAAGMILYLAGDLRFALQDEHLKFGLNEVAIGIPLPRWIVAQCSHAVPPRFHTEVLLHAEIMDPALTHRRGITHDLATSPDALLALALDQATRLARLDAEAYRITKRRLREPVLQACGGMEGEDLEEFAAVGPFRSPA